MPASESDFSCDSQNSLLSSPAASSELFDPLQSVTSLSGNSQSGDTDSGVHVIDQEGEKDGNTNLFSVSLILLNNPNVDFQPLNRSLKSSFPFFDIIWILF